MKSLIMAALLSISSTVSATEPEPPPIPQRYPVMDEAAGLARVILIQCRTMGSVIITIPVNGETESFMVDCTVTSLGVKK